MNNIDFYIVINCYIALGKKWKCNKQYVHGHLHGFVKFHFHLLCQQSWYNSLSFWNSRREFSTFPSNFFLSSFASFVYALPIHTWTSFKFSILTRPSFLHWSLKMMCIMYIVVFMVFGPQWEGMIGYLKHSQHKM
jgi:hypothetical protein